MVRPVKRSSALLFLTVPACLATGWYATRAIGEMQTISSESVVATFPAAAEQSIDLPAAGSYWVVGIGPPEAMKAARAWAPTLVNAETLAAESVDTGDPERSSKRKNLAGLDLLFTMRVPTAGRYLLRLTNSENAPREMHLRVTRFSRAGANVAMRSMGAGVLFSALLLISAILWFRRR